MDTEVKTISNLPILHWSKWNWDTTRNDQPIGNV